MVKTASCCILLLFLLAGSSSALAAEREGCVICGMYLDLYAKTSYTITFDDGSSRSTCSLACAARIINEQKVRVKDVRVGNFLSGGSIDARKAFFLEGSTVPGVMSNTSRIAFPSKKDALEFQNKHGGKIVTFEEALANQLKEQQ